MKLNNFISFSLVLLLLFFSSCEQDVTTSPPKTLPSNTGILFVDSKPQGARIFLNGEFTGHSSPDTVKWMDEGVYTLTLKLRFYKDTSIQINVKDNQTSSYFLDYSKNPSMLGSLLCDSNPTGALIFISDSSTGKYTPDIISGLTPGYYKVRLTKSGYWDARAVGLVQSSVTNFIPTQILVDSTVWVIFKEENSQLPFNLLNSVAVDKNNIVWIGTHGKGLARFDGKNWNVFDTDNSPLESNYISTIYVDDENHKWIGTHLGGLYEYDDQSWKTFNKNNSGLPGDDITSVLLEKTGALWVGTISDGIALRRDSGIWRILNTANSPLISNKITDITVDKNNIKWIATDGGGIMKYVGPREIILYRQFSSSVISPFYGMNTNNYYSIAVDYNNKVFAGSNLGLTSWEGFTWKSLGGGPGNVKSIVVDKANYLWYATDGGGLVKYKDGIIKILSASNSPLSSNKLTSVAIDKSGYKWIASYGDGLIKYKGN
jgi:hypothetical protein